MCQLPIVESVRANKKSLPEPAVPEGFEISFMPASGQRGGLRADNNNYADPGRARNLPDPQRQNQIEASILFHDSNHIIPHPGAPERDPP